MMVYKVEEIKDLSSYSFFYIILSPLIWLTLSHKYLVYQPPEPLRLKEMMKFNQTSNKLRLIDDLVVVWPLQYQVKSDRFSKNSLGEATGKEKKTSQIQ